MQSRKVLFATISLVASVSAYGQVDYNNLGYASVGGDSASLFGPLYDSFSVGTSPAIVSSVTLSVVNPDAMTGDFSVGLYQDDGVPGPGALITSTDVSDTLIGVNAMDLTVSFASTSLLANTRYWIGLSDVSQTGGNAPNRGVIWTFDATGDGAGVFGEYFYNQNGLFGNVNGPYQMAIESTPEPSTLAGLAVGVAPLALVRRRRRTRTAPSIAE